MKSIKNKNFTVSYLSWANAWGLVKAIYPDATYKIKEYPNWQQLPDGTFQQVGTLDYRITSVGCEVEVTVNIEFTFLLKLNKNSLLNYTQKLYPMDAKNEPIMKPSIKDINKAQMRCLVKALATAGLGLNIYAGDDLPSGADNTPKRREKAPQTNQGQQLNKTEPTKQELMDYPITFNGTRTTMGILLKHYKTGLSTAVEFANSLKGNEKLVFDKLKAMD